MRRIDYHYSTLHLNHNNFTGENIDIFGNIRQFNGTNKFITKLISFSYSYLFSSPDACTCPRCIRDVLVSHNTTRLELEKAPMA